jgi:hypothetical protein
MANFLEITFTKVKSEIERFLKTEHSKADILYSPASPYGQILSVIENLHQLSFLYLKNAIKQFDLSDANALNPRIIRNAAIFAGHIPGRAISATGTLKMTIKTSSDVEKDIPGGRITLFNRQALKNKTNGLDYAINLGSEKSTFKITSNSQFFIPIVQGKWDTKTFTGSGEENQTYQVNLRGNQKDVENFNIEVLVDGELYSIKKHIYEMIPDDASCVVRTGFNGGIDVIFGNGGFGRIPRISSVISVNYLITDGAVGSIFRRTSNDWTFLEPVIDGFGHTINVSNIFDIGIYTDINFGADKETLEFTKNVLPIVSNNFVLGLPQQYAYQIKKLGVFSHVNAYEDHGTIFIVATPNIKLFKSQNSNYFSIDIRSFELDNYEKNKIELYLKTGGNILLSKRFIITSPKLSYYVMNVFIISYSDAQDDSVDSQIHDIISEYFLNFNRIGRVPKVDLVKRLATITDLHSVDISFTSKKNEDFHKKLLLDNTNRRNQFASKDDLKLDRPPLIDNSNVVVGLDPILGDIIFEASEVPIIRGGFNDRNGIYYSDNIEDKSLKSVNIIRKGTVSVSNKPSI